MTDSKKAIYTLEQWQTDRDFKADPGIEKNSTATAVKSYLKQYRKEARSAKSMLREYHRERRLFKKYIEATPGRAWGTAEEKSKIEEMKRDIANRINEWPERIRPALEKSAEIKRIIDAVPGTEGELLHKRYIERMTWEKIAEAIGYSWSSTHDIHVRALNKAAEIMKAQGVDLPEMIREDSN